MDLDQHDICASSGSACTSGTLEVSHVLTALGLTDELARGSVRLTTGRATMTTDVERLLAVMPDVVARVRSIMPMLLGARESSSAGTTSTRQQSQRRLVAEPRAQGDRLCVW